MRVLHVTDFHSQEEWYRWLVGAATSYDVVCLTGDLVDLEAVRARGGREFERVIDWIRQIEAPLLICSGNHDAGVADLLGGADATWLDRLRTDSCWIDAERVKVRGQEFGATGWLQSNVPGADIWLTHLAPVTCAVGVARSLDERESQQAWARNFGRPHMVLCGHEHRPCRWWDSAGGMLLLNPGFAEGAREPNRITLDLARGFAEWRSAGFASERIPLPEWFSVR